MNFKYRYGLLFLLSVAALASLFFLRPIGLHRESDEGFGGRHHKSLRRLPRRLSHVSRNNISRRNFVDLSASENLAGQDLRSFTILSSQSFETGSRISRTKILRAINDGKIKTPLHGCRMQNCFDHKICEKNGFRVYVYPENPSAPIVSGKYKEIINSIRRSRYYTNDPDEACLFILSLDTLDRDPLSTQYVHNLGLLLKHLNLWKGGANHVVFNLYSGTWPDYSENDIGFDLGMAMLAKSSISQQHFRPDFDISLPLFHKEHSFKGGESGFLATSGILASHRRYTLVFKGKRYLVGIGSETRNSLHHVDNGQDIVLLTTCKHGKDWKNMEDERCESDNKEYDKWDYKVLLKNSTFCLVPRGRRLGSYRFLEALQAGCIPVILSNDWVLPFSEVIDWKKAVIWADERLLLQLPTIVRSMDMKTILSMSQQTQFLWDTYFSSMDKIVATTLEIIKSRLEVGGNTRTSKVWNSSPGGLVFLPEYSQSLNRYPFYGRHVDASELGIQNEPISSPRTSNATKQFMSSSSPNKVRLESDSTADFVFDAVVRASNMSLPPHLQQSPLQRVLKMLVKCKGLRKIYVLWDLNGNSVPNFKWIHYSVPVLHRKVQPQVGQLYLFLGEDGDDDQDHAGAILNLDENSLLTSDEVDFGFHVWKNFPNRIVGYFARSHFWHDAKESWRFTSKATSEFSMVVTSPAFYHRYYNHLYMALIPPSLKQVAATCKVCHDILLNALVSHVTKLPPIKVGARHRMTTNDFQQANFNSDEFVHSNNKLEVNSNRVSNMEKDVEEVDDKHADLFHNVLLRRTGEAAGRIVTSPDDPNTYDRFQKNNFYVPLHTNSSSLLKSNHSSSMNASLQQNGIFVESKLFHHFECAHYCLQAISDYLGYMPLLKSSLRINPLLFKDPVSRLRKKYPSLDKVT